MIRARNLTAILNSSLLLFGLAWLATPALAAPAAKVDVCHFPPGNPDNFHTIRISENALSAHLAHGDLPDSCNALCAGICDDGDACTVDDTGDCEQVGCPTVRDPVDCDDSLGCTDDSCDSAAGCVNDERVCIASDLCHLSMCAEPEGQCLETEVVCSSGYSCNPDNGLCEADGPGPCFDANDCLDAGTRDCLVDSCEARAQCPNDDDHIRAVVQFGGSDCVRGNSSACDSVNQGLRDLGCLNVCDGVPPSGPIAACGCSRFPGDPVFVGICAEFGFCDDSIGQECANFCATRGLSGSQLECTDVCPY